jgi:prepilin-type N-terminal cleavage/methylation domain-containing protein
MFYNKDIQKAFTLIELLIVVAIIAILAAIAVPNFLEAQTRSKVSRTKADMRSIATALEAYEIDYNKYPMDTYTKERYFPPGYGGTHIQNYVPLTTPTSFITSVPRDVFPYPREEEVLQYFHYKNWDTSYGKAVYQVDVYVAEGVSQDWCLHSLGPDLLFDGVDWHPVSLQYDPTNGTVSRGDISRWGP